ncbi:MAG: aminotransferase class I/II-fold pyridoxal phosphate-dependent enzyme [Pseudomonadota bacterium]
MRNSKRAPATDLAQAGHFIDAETRAVVPPIHSATTFARDGDYQLGGYVYSRYDNPTYAQAEYLIAGLEGGAASLLFASGLAAATAVFEPLPAGAHVIAPRVMYHGLQDWLRSLAKRGRITLDLVDAADPKAIEAAVRPDETALIWIETLTNPTWDVIDVAEAARIAHAAGARLGVDATVSPPVTCRPLDLGADIVFHSTTKYLNGHSDVMGGVLTTAQDDAPWAEITAVRKYVGGIMGPFEAWLLLRGMRTLSLRFERASANALGLARHFDGHQALERVLYAGLPGHPGHDVATRQLTAGCGGMMSLLVKGGAEAALTVARSVEVFVPATSLGGVESLIEHRATVEGPESITPANLLRLSVGIEDLDDLIADLEQALARI